MSELSPRKVIRTDLFNEALTSLIPEQRNSEEFIKGAEASLAEKPEIGSLHAEGRKVYFLPMSPVGVKQVSLYYTFDDETVWLLFIASVPEPPEKRYSE